MVNKGSTSSCRFASGDIVYMINTRFVSRRQPFVFIELRDDGIARVAWLKRDNTLGAVWCTPVDNLCIGWAF